MTDLDRTKVTFEQAEGLEPLPSQLKPKVLTKGLRAGLWYVLHAHLTEATEDFNWTISGDWRAILRDLHIFRNGTVTLAEFTPKLRPLRFMAL